MTCSAQCPPGTRVTLRPIEPADNEQMAQIVRSVLTELGFGGPGYSSSDPEVSAMAEAYSAPRCAYFVLVSGTTVVGGGGIGPLAGGDPDTCELRKMYLLPEARGQGMGRELLQLCLATARRLGFQRCYLETFMVMEAARALYTRTGFTRLAGPLGATGHSAPDAFYLLEL